jgi:hypothetical protein
LIAKCNFRAFTKVLENKTDQQQLTIVRQVSLEADVFLTALWICGDP